MVSNRGVDLNRNYGYGWGSNDTGSSPNPCSATYRGESEFSEPETQAVRDFIIESILIMFYIITPIGMYIFILGEWFIS